MNVRGDAPGAPRPAPGPGRVPGGSAAGAGGTPKSPAGRVGLAGRRSVGPKAVRPVRSGSVAAQKLVGSVGSTVSVGSGASATGGAVRQVKPSRSMAR